MKPSEFDRAPASLPSLFNHVNQAANKSRAKQKNYDVIVLGIGSMGSATCHFLAQRGINVLGVEQFDISHEFGSHAGQSRIIRQAYFEHPDYVPLLKRAYTNWQSLEHLTNTQFIYKTGLLYMGRNRDMLISGVRKSSKLYNLPVDDLTASNNTLQYPQFTLSDDYEMLYEANAGFVTPERAILLYSAMALQKGSHLHTHEKVLKWTTNNDSITVNTDKGIYNCTKLIITAGSWAGKLIPKISDKLTITRQLVSWIKPKNAQAFNPDVFPCWTLEDEHKPGIYYGFPMLQPDKFGGSIGLKLGHHSPGKTVDPDNPDRSPTKEELNDLVKTLDRFMPGTFEDFYESKICLYTNTPDQNFIVDFLPGYKNVVVAAGFSGHGFKFSSVMGEILSDLAIKGKTTQPIDFLSANRFF